MKHLLLFAVAALLLAAGCQDATDMPTSAGPAGRLEPSSTADVIVVLDRAFAPGGGQANRGRAAEVARGFGLSARHTYGTALFGFSASVPTGRIEALRRDPRVVAVAPDEIHAIDVQDLPTGVNRTDLDLNPSAGIGTGVTVNLDVAILDTGIDPAHPDLNVAGGRNFTPGSPKKWQDQHSHGTHVAGTVGALDNGIGVVGVAPGVRLWAFKVCRPGGFCYSSERIAGIDWIAARKVDYKAGKSSGIDFVSANMSIGFTGDSQTCVSDPAAGPIHLAVCGMVDEGVVLSMSAGNASAVRAAWPETIVVSALADFDGRAGGNGVPTCRPDEDDTLANFSNYGPTVDIAAPGVCILSSLPGGSYGLFSGTSMASPHVAGAVALYVHVNGLAPAVDGVGAASIKAALVGAALPQSDPCGYVNEHAGAGSDEPLLFLNGATFGSDGACEVDAGPPPDFGPSVTVTHPAHNSTVSGVVVVTADANDDDGVVQVEFLVNGSSIGVDTDDTDGWSMAWDTAPLVNGGSYQVRARATDTAAQTGDDTVSVTVDNTPPPVGPLHIGDLDPIKVALGGKWRAQVDITVHDENHNSIVGATPEGVWSGNEVVAGEVDSCTTQAVWGGRCAVSSSAMKNRYSSATLTMTGITHVLGYDASENHDANGNSDGTSVTVNK